MGGTCEVPISRLLLSSTKASNANPHKPSANSVIPKTTRRFLLFSLPLSTLSATALLPLSTDNAVRLTSPSVFAASFDPVSQAERDASTSVSRRISEAVGLLEKGRELQARGDFSKALDYFTQVVQNYKEFAFSEYARVGRALALYEVGDREEAIAEMEDVSIALKGYPEIHAALAAALYVDKHAPLLAENQFTIATLLDPRYVDVSYVKEMKHWPPSLTSKCFHNRSRKLIYEANFYPS
ncbi:uncharacterized protein LOC110816071 isoform X2 [Carica papaya]|uniref:uncharacterized protein LOC110816071 isoform X2 n=1 Tax=Carica papaya TaxID=3649 RepID=UPI000B8CDECD|nr:uncharacterized protein LOC110816071 isoform X2 [Carica papaya]